jgi:hypothetical protein
MLEELIALVWGEVASHFHGPTQQWAGPHARTYSSLVRKSYPVLISRGTAGSVILGEFTDIPDREERRVPLACPRHLWPLFAEPLSAPRTVTRLFIPHDRVLGTTYLHPAFAVRAWWVEGRLSGWHGHGGDAFRHACEKG